MSAFKPSSDSTKNFLPKKFQKQNKPLPKNGWKSRGIHWIGQGQETNAVSAERRGKDQKINREKEDKLLRKNREKQNFETFTYYSL